jgi:hypothetical protein
MYFPLAVNVVTYQIGLRELKRSGLALALALGLVDLRDYNHDRSISLGTRQHWQFLEFFQLLPTDYRNFPWD